MNKDYLGEEMYELAKKIFPICRSITGKGVRETLNIIKSILPDLIINEISSGTSAFDWTIPKEWNIKEAWIKNSKGETIVDFKNNNLHVVGYSIPVNRKMKLNELKEHLYTLPEQPDWIPYVTSYYNERFGFCLSHNDIIRLEEDTYHVFIDSSLKDGSLAYGEIVIPGISEEEIFFSTYVCHPSMANNEVSGPCVQTFLAKYISNIKDRRYTYRFVFIPETIGSISYLSKNFKDLKKKVIAGFNLSCVGDDRAYSYLPSRYGNTLADRVAINTLNNSNVEFEKYSFLDRGSDERQYCSPGIDLPVCSIMRTKYGEYPEYHTSADDLDLISSKGLHGAFVIYKNCIDTLEKNKKYKVTCLCEPQLGKRGLYPNLSVKGSSYSVRTMMDFLAYADGTNDLIEISSIIKKPLEELIKVVDACIANELIIEC